jgi:hypothetical protein
MRALLAVLMASTLAACSFPEPGSDSPDAATVPTGDAGLPPDDPPSTASGCQGVFNPDQVLDYHFTMPPTDWAAIVADPTFSVYYPAEMRCGDGEPLQIGLRRKRSGGTEKPALKVDVNLYSPDQAYFGLKKLNLDIGTSTGDGEGTVDDLIREYLAWRLMVGSGVHSPRVAVSRVFVNGELIGAYNTIEQINRGFLRSRFGDASGWLYKHSGGAGDGYKTNEGVDNPYAPYFCFWEANPCPTPPADELLATLPERLDLQQLLVMGAVNALIANTDAPIFKRNNYYFYDWPGGRVYIPWDLDTVMRHDLDVFAGPRSGMPLYTDVLFPSWEADYGDVLEDLLDGPLSLDAIDAELARLLAVAGAAIDADPQMAGDAATVTAALGAWWSARHDDVRGQISSR